MQVEMQEQPSQQLEVELSSSGRSSSLRLTASAVATQRLDNFVRGNFFRLECQRFVPTESSRGERCGCNRSRQWHVERGIAVDQQQRQQRQQQQQQQQTWSSATCCKRLPTNAHGKIKFKGFGRERPFHCPKFLRLQSSLDNPESLWQLLTDADKWSIPAPEFALSVSGGAGKMRRLPREMIERLKQAVLSLTCGVSSIWIITLGYSVGVAAQFGELLEEAISSDLMGGSVALIGVCTWGQILNQHMLEDDDIFSKAGDPLPGEKVRRYDYEKSEADPNSLRRFLNKSHTHFLLADDGSSGRECTLQLRSQLEKLIGDKMRERNSCSPPVVQLCVEGGRFTLKSAMRAATDGTPVIAVKGSGRSADLLAWAKETRQETRASEVDTTDNGRQSSERELQQQLEQKVQLLASGVSDSELQELKTVLERFATDAADSPGPHLLQVFDPLCDCDLSYAILSSVFQHDNFKHDTLTQLKLTIAWNRADIADAEILQKISDAQLQEINLDRLFIEVLAAHQMQFVELFLDYGVSVDSAVTLEGLQSLYKESLSRGTRYSDRLLAQIVRSSDRLDDFCGCLIRDSVLQNVTDLRAKLLPLINNMLKSMTWGVVDNIYTEKNLKPDNSGSHTKLIYPPRTHDGRRKFNNQDLFIWAILSYHPQFAKMFWKNGKNHISCALVGRLLLKRMAEDAADNDETEMQAQFEAVAQEFEQLAVGVLEDCYDKNRDVTKALLIRNLPMWNGLTVLSLAAESECREFMHHPCVQDLLTMIWMGGIPRSVPIRRSIYCVIFPFLIPLLIFKTHRGLTNARLHKWLRKNRRGSRWQRDQQSSEDLESDDRLLQHVLKQAEKVDTTAPNTREYLETIMVDEAADNAGLDLRSKRQLMVDSLYHKRQGFMQLSFLRSIHLFYSAPSIKCMLNCLSFLSFITLFAYVALVQLRQRVEDTRLHWTEWYISVWIVQFIAEEVRQFMHLRSLTAKLAGLSYWDKFDIVVSLLLATCTGLRACLGPSTIEWARCFYALTLAMFCVRFMQFYYAHQSLGPQVLMIIEMFSDIFFFICILIIFLLAFGISSLSLLDKPQQLNADMLRDIVYGPYWKVFGDLGLESLQTDSTVRQVFIIVLLALYMLGTNILLVNMLIAMFGNTFNRVQESSQKYWSLLRYELIEEYYYRPSLPPPLIALPYLWRFAKFAVNFIRTRCCRYCSRCAVDEESMGSSDDFVMHLNLAYHQRLQAFEARAAESQYRRVVADAEDN